MSRRQGPFRYQRLVAQIEDKILNGTYRPGEKLPSIRMLHRMESFAFATELQSQ